MKRIVSELTAVWILFLAWPFKQIDSWSTIFTKSFLTSKFPTEPYPINNIVSFLEWPSFSLRGIWTEAEEKREQRGIGDGSGREKGTERNWRWERKRKRKEKWSLNKKENFAKLSMASMVFELQLSTKTADYFCFSWRFTSFPLSHSLNPSAFPPLTMHKHS